MQERSVRSRKEAQTGRPLRQGDGVGVLARLDDAIARDLLAVVDQHYALSLPHRPDLLDRALGRDRIGELEGLPRGLLT